MFRFDLTGQVGDLSIAAATSVQAGEALLVTGPSGSGKTTLLRMLAGLHPVASGDIELNGEKWFANGAGRPAGERQIGFVFQNSALFPRMSALRNVTFGMRGEAREDRALEILESLGLSAVVHSRASRLSGGEQQRVAIARAVASDPQLLLLDEPFTALDTDNAVRAAEVVSNAIRSFSIPAVLVTHRPVPQIPFGQVALRLEAGKPAVSVSADSAFSLTSR